MNNLKNIIFDLGGVLINIDYNKTANAFKQLGFDHFEKMYSQFAADELFEKLETGHIDPDAFYKVMLSAGKEGISNEDITQAWNAMLLDFRIESLDYLNELKGSYNLYLLSNTNAIHQAAFNALFTKQTGIASIDRFFTKAYYSHVIGMRKPNADIFNFVLEDAALCAGETMFIDDTPENIETAKKLGFGTHLLLPGQKIESLIYG